VKHIIPILVILLFLSSGFVGVSYTVEKPSPVSFDGNTLYVGGSGEGNYSKIQDALGDASDGDTVFVYDDSSPYYENVIVDKTINLIGEDKNTTVIDGGGSGDVVYVSADEVYISGFTIQNSGYGEYPYYAGINICSISNTITGNNISSNDGYGIGIYNSSSNIITDNIILHNEEDGIRLETSKDNIITGNIITLDNMNSIVLKDSDSNSIVNNTLSNNVVGISLYYSNSNTIIGNDITNNFLSGMLLWGHSNTVTGNNISSNKHRGGIWLLHAFDSTIKENTIISNNQYGIDIDSESSRNIIMGNNISKNDDGIILQYYSNRNTIKGNIISNNLCGINLSSSFNVILKNNFLSNERHAFFSGSIEVNLKINLSDDERRVFFHPASRNHWLRNYWEGDNSLPVRINGMKSFYLTNRSYDIIWDFHIPWVDFDWLPAQEPYDIGV